MLKILSTVSILLMVKVSGMEIPFVLNIQDLLNTSNNIKTIADENLPIESLLSNNSQLNEALDLIDGLKEKIVGFENQLPFGIEITNYKFDRDTQQRIQRVYFRITRLDYTYETFLTEIEGITNFDEKTLQNLYDSLSSVGRTSVQKDLSKLYEVVIPSEDYTLWEMLQMHRENSSTLEVCDMKQSYQYQMFRLYRIIILAELKGLIINTYLFKTYFSSMNVNIVDLVEKAQGEFVRRINQYLKAIQKVMSEISREIYLCDSSTYYPGRDYLELEGLFTAYVVSEYEFHSFEDICIDSCQDIRSYLLRRCYNNNGQEFCTSHECDGLTHKCQKIGGRVDLCEEDPSSLKRYRYIKSNDKNKLYGKWSNCKNGKFAILDTFWYRDNQCDVCMCQCSQNIASSRAIRTFNLRPQISKIDENKVVSNFRFVLKDNMIHIQIEESPLQKYGLVDRNNLLWVPLENFETMSNNGSTSFEENIDFAIVTDKSPLMNLDEISAGPYYVLTGVRLNRDNKTTAIQLEIYVTPFDFTSGQLNPTEDNPSIWLTSMTQLNPSSEYLQTRFIFYCIM